MLLNRMISRFKVRRSSKYVGLFLISLSCLTILECIHSSRMNSLLIVDLNVNDSRISIYRNRSELITNQCDSSVSYSGESQMLLVKYPWLNGAIYRIQSQSLIYCTIPKIASKTTISLLIYVYIRDLLQRLQNKSINVNDEICKHIPISLLINQMKKNGITISNEVNQSNSTTSILQTYLNLLQYESLDKNSSSIFFNPWRLDIGKLFDEIQFRKVLNLSELYDSSYSRVIFVRHPFERLASAYKERIGTLPKDRIQSEPYYDNVRRLICARYSKVTSYQQRLSVRQSCENSIPSFEHFVEYVLSLSQTNTNVDRMDAHWKPFSRICQVCLFKYNFILKYETFNDDLRMFLNRLNVSHWNIDKRRGASGHSNQQYKQFYSNLPNQLICRLIKLYYDDFHLFNYRIDDYVNTTALSCS